MKRKPFNKDWHASSDEKARTYAKEMFKKHYGLEAKDNPDQYGVDLIIYDKGDIVCYAEVEIKKYLSNFNFDTLHILERKSKFFKNINGKSVLFCLFSPDGKVCAMTKGSYLVDMTPVEVKNNAMEADEFFYKVPMRLVRMFTV